VSDSLWVRTPGSVYVAEDHVLALKVFLDGLAAEVAELGSQVAYHARKIQDDPWSSTKASAILALSSQIQTLAGDADHIVHSLGIYAARTAAEEYARMATFEVPLQRLFALAFWSFKRRPFNVSPHRVTIPMAAYSLLGPEFHPRETKVWQVQGVDSNPVQRAKSVEERIFRIPVGGAPIRIERYHQPDGLVATEVFIAGTQSWGLQDSLEPFDAQSNVALVAGLLASSMIAVELALKRSGVRPGDRVTFVGHSQGGIIATRLAESGKYTTTGLITAGAPLGSTPVRGNYPALVLSHSDDVVPGLAGHYEPTRAWRIERHSGSATGDFTAAHSLESYLQTAQQVDSSPGSDLWGNWSESSGETTPTFFRSERKPLG
jgi:hypothetical protein